MNFYLESSCMFLELLLFAEKNEILDSRRPTAMGPQKYKNELHFFFIAAAIISDIFFLYVPRYGLGE